MTKRILGASRMRVICAFAAVANGFLYVFLASKTPSWGAAAVMLSFCVIFFSIAAALVWRVGVSESDAQLETQLCRVLAILLPGAACLNARVAIFSLEKGSGLDFGSAWFDLIRCFSCAAMVLTVIHSIPRLERRPEVAEWALIVGCISLAAFATSRQWSDDRTKALSTLWQAGHTHIMLMSALNNEILVLLQTGDWLGASCLMRFLLLEMFLACFLYGGWDWDWDTQLFFLAAILQCSLLCCNSRRLQHLSNEPGSHRPAVGDASRTQQPHCQSPGSPESLISVDVSDASDEVPSRCSCCARCCRNLLTSLETWRGGHVLGVLNGAGNLVFFLAANHNLSEGITCTGPLLQCDVLKDGGHVVEAATLISAVAIANHVCALAIDVLGQRRGTLWWQVDSSFRGGAFLKASLLWMKIVILFYTKPEANASSGILAVVAAITLFLFNLVSVTPILKLVQSGGGSLSITESRNYQVGGVMAAIIDAVIVLFLACAFAHVQSFVKVVQTVDVDIMLFLPCTYLFPIFALCNELTQIARGRIELPSGVSAMALQCVYAIPLHFLVNIVLPATFLPGLSITAIFSGWPGLLLTLTTAALVVGGAQVMMGCNQIEDSPGIV